ncbi:hypothetical protein DPEC_G00147690 [Dallia pectoralis]|uniref:Uncharacterized protein n=1 Tax=Dallia pectoralis TaxID=75939 RepID=A0ACC2GI75_DALPE|nr:hypothetical protein DPEC_G00147690 [Dallia pectoralis]
MMRSSLVKELLRSLPLVHTAVNRQGVCKLSPPNLSVPLIRPVYTGFAMRNDVPKAEKLDLDIWKSVMRSQVPLAEEKQGDEEGEGESGSAPSEPEGGAASEKDVSSTLEVTRELVVMWRHAGKLVPESMTDEELGILGELETKSSKKKYLKYLSIRENHKKSHKEKQEKRKAERSEGFLEDDRISPDSSRGEGGELKNTFLLQFWSSSMDKLLSWRSAQAMRFGQPLVFDMSYDQHMARRETENAVSQLLDVEGWNRRSLDPFHLHYCSLQPGGGYHRQLVKRYGADAWENLLVTCTEKQHVDLYPREDLVYLTADSRNVLRTFDHSKVYIVGSIVDRSIQSGLSLANAKRLKLNTARLPLDEFLQWDCGAKNLTLDQMIRILLTVKETGSWQKALEHVPKRKHDGFYQEVSNRDGQGFRDSHKTRAFSERGKDPRFRSGDRAFRSEDGDKPFDRRDRAFRSEDGDKPFDRRDRAFRMRMEINHLTEGTERSGVRMETAWKNGDREWRVASGSGLGTGYGLHRKTKWTTGRVLQRVGRSIENGMRSSFI